MFSNRHGWLETTQIAGHLLVHQMAAGAPEQNVEQLIVDTLAKDAAGFDTLAFAEKHGLVHQAAVGAMKSLEGLKYVAVEKLERQVWKLTDEAREIIAKGAPEVELFERLAAGPKTLGELKDAMGERYQIGHKQGMKLKLFATEKKDPVELSIISRGDKAPAALGPDTVQANLAKAAKGEAVDAKDVKELKSRKLADLKAESYFKVTKGEKFNTKIVKPVSDLTREMLLDGSWKTTEFKQYTLENAAGAPPPGGNLHPLLKVRQEFREMFLEMGFQEMETRDWVESCFWNFDTLFVPQKHPARDAQDTFFIKDPKTSAPPPREYFEMTKQVHENAYCMDWSADEAQRNVLRTHTTAVSSWVLYHLAQASPMKNKSRQFKPGKYFSIDRVFRNEEMDKTHLCEFHQVEGFMVDRNLSLANMMHTIHTFFKKVGIEQLRFKPAFNPYTEPSMEIFGYHEGMKRWMELGNSGVFRAEMLKPMGFDDDVTAIAWGLSLERPTMIKYGIRNIHELFGHKVDLKFIRKSRIARY